MNVLKEPHFPLKILLLFTKYLRTSSLYYDTDRSMFMISEKWKLPKLIWILILCVLCLDFYRSLVNTLSIDSVTPTRKITIYVYALFGMTKFFCYVICIRKYDFLICNILNNLVVIQKQHKLLRGQIKFQFQRTFTFYMLLAYVLFFSVQWINTYFVDKISWYIIKMTIYSHFRKCLICIVDGQFIVMYIIQGEIFEKLNFILTNLKEKHVHVLIQLIVVHQNLRIYLQKTNQSFSLIILMSLIFNFYVISSIIMKFALIKKINGEELLEIFMTAMKILWIIFVINQCTQQVSVNIGIYFL